MGLFHQFAAAIASIIRRRSTDVKLSTPQRTDVHHALEQVLQKKESLHVFLHLLPPNNDEQSENQLCRGHYLTNKGQATQDFFHVFAFRFKVWRWMYVCQLVKLGWWEKLWENCRYPRGWAWQGGWGFCGVEYANPTRLNLYWFK